jgi:hypothetical protein
MIAENGSARPGVRVNVSGVPRLPRHWKNEIPGRPGVRVIAKQFGVDPGTCSASASLSPPQA